MDNHSIFDKRQKKPRVYRVAEWGEDYTLQEFETFDFGKSTLKFITPNFVALSMSSHAKALENAKKSIKSFFIHPFLRAMPIIFFRRSMCFMTVLLPHGFCPLSGFLVRRKISNSIIKRLFKLSSDKSVFRLLLIYSTINFSVDL